MLKIIIYFAILLLICSCQRTNEQTLNSETEQEPALGISIENNLFPNNENIVIHYVTANLRLRDSDDLSSDAITTLPQYTTVKILETGRTETIDGITAPWIRVVSQTGFTGWCFSGYVSQREPNTAETIAITFAERSPGTYPGTFGQNISSRENVTLIDTIKMSNGYYIQQAERRFQERGRAPEILTLSVENENVYIREIDIFNNETIVRNEIRLSFDGQTYVHNRTRLEMINGEMQIFYSEHIPDNVWRGTWDYRNAYTFAGNLVSSMPHHVFRLTTDYLITFSGQYIFDSYELINQENMTLDIDLIKRTVIQIDYDHLNKCLTISNDNLRSILRDLNRDEKFNFIETLDNEPFWWIYGEGAGFSEERLFFYEGGIAFTYEFSGGIWGENAGVRERIGERYIKYVTFFRRDI